MATTERLAREQCEKAFAGFFNSIKAGSPLAAPDVPVFIRKGSFNADGVYELENPNEIPLPSLCLACPRSKPHEMGYPICELHVVLLTSADETDASTQQSARFGFVSEALDDSHMADVQAALSKPAAGPDNRTVKNFTVFGFYQTEDMGQEADRRWIDQLVIDVHCTPSDDID